MTDLLPAPFPDPFQDINDFKKLRIIDTEGFDRRLAELVQQTGGQIFATDGAVCTTDGRAAALALFRDVLAAGREHLRQAHLHGASGRCIVRGHAFLMDMLILRLMMLVKTGAVAAEGNARAAADVAADTRTPLLSRLRRLIREHRTQLNKPQDDEFCIIATGGYGRGELAPFSDVDLLFLLPDGEHPKFAGQIELILYFLWDLRLDIGHAVRNIDECIEQASGNMEICTSMLESRFLTGNRALFNRYHGLLFERILGHDSETFVQAKRLEQQQRHERFGHSLFYLEPNIKENPGGLRDIHVFMWIAKYRYRVRRLDELIPLGIITEEEYRTLIRCREFLRRVRNALHYVVGRKDDRLTFQAQLEIAAGFGYRDRPGMRGVEQFMRRYYQVAKQIGNLSQLLLQKFSDQPGGSNASGSVMAIGAGLVADPRQLMRVFRDAQRDRCAIHSDTLRAISAHLQLVNQEFRRDPHVACMFLEILASGEPVGPVLRAMNACQLLGRYLPEFGRIMGQTQHDLFHVYTVDEHTIMATEALDDLRAGHFSEELPISTELVRQVKHREILYLGVICHDIAKGRGEQHEIKGAVMARQIGERLGLHSEEIDQVAWLVEHHLVFSRTAFRRDLNDPYTIQQFASQMENQNNLDMLLLLTVADIRAVGPKVWNQWKATSLRQLYRATLETLNKGMYTGREHVQRYAESKKETVLRLVAHRHPVEQARKHLDQFYPEYFIGYDPEDLAAHYDALAALWEQPLAIAFTTNPVSGTTTMLVHTQDHAGLLARVSGALAAAGVNILAAQGNTMRNGMALEVFVIQTSQGDTVHAPDRQEKIRQTLSTVLSGQASPDRLFAAAAVQRRKNDLFEVPVAIVADNDYSETHTILEITALDRVGLLYTITREMERLGLQISTAKIATYGERAVDVFYVKDLFGLKLPARKIGIVVRALNERLGGPTVPVSA